MARLSETTRMYALRPSGLTVLVIEAQSEAQAAAYLRDHLVRLTPAEAFEEGLNFRLRYRTPEAEALNRSGDDVQQGLPLGEDPAAAGGDPP